MHKQTQLLDGKFLNVQTLTGRHLENLEVQYFLNIRVLNTIHEQRIYDTKSGLLGFKSWSPAIMVLIVQQTSGE